jgi:single-strand DNA-binding protein
MISLNRVTLLGNVGKDPETRYIDSGVPKTTFTLATSDSYLTKEGKRITETEWHNIVLWRGLASLAEKFLRKGHQVYVEGKLTHRSYLDKEGNTKRYTEIVASGIVFLNKNKDGQGDELSTDFKESESIEETSQEKDNNNMDDLPF